MIRTSTIFIAICMVLISASLGVVLFSTTGLSVSESGLVALASLTFLILYNAIQMRLRDRADLGGQIGDLSRGTADLARQVAEFGRRIAIIESKLGANGAASDERVRALTVEMGELGAIINNLATSVAAHDELLTAAVNFAETESASPPQQPAPVAVPARTETTPEPQTTALPPVTIETAASPPAEPAKNEAESTMNGSEVLAAVRGATESNRIDLYLQPIVSLPQRKVRFYETVSRLRDDKDRLISATQFVEAAEASGLIGQIDYLVLFRCVQVLRRLQVRSKDIGLFCNVSGITLGNPDIFGQCIEFLETNRALASSLVLEFKHATFRNLGPTEIEHLTTLKGLGFRFSIDNVSELRFDGRELADRGVRYIKVPAPLLLDQKQAASADIHAADLSNLLSRFGIDLIAEKIEGERAVVDLLDFDVRFGQGFLFSAPRPLKPENANATTAADAEAGKRNTPTQTASTRAVVPATAGRAAETRLTGNAALARRVAAQN
jgi:cyclic-di-GMP phosphodiesterase, flagellum assembly factor TipF